jgi:hypothetical protein
MNNLEAAEFEKLSGGIETGNNDDDNDDDDDGGGGGFWVFMRI